MKYRQRASCYDQAAIRGTRESRDAVLDLAGVAHIDRHDLYPQRRRGGLDGSELSDPGCNSGVSKNCSSRNAGGDLLEQFKKFSADAVFKQHKAGSIAARA